MNHFKLIMLLLSVVGFNLQAKKDLEEVVENNFISALKRLEERNKKEQKYRAGIRRKALFMDIVSCGGLFKWGKRFRRKNSFHLGIPPFSK